MADQKDSDVVFPAIYMLVNIDKVIDGINEGKVMMVVEEIGLVLIIVTMILLYLFGRELKLELKLLMNMILKVDPTLIVKDLMKLSSISFDKHQQY